MIPIRGDVPARGVPWMVVALASANLVVFAGVLLLATGPDGEARVAELLSRWGLVPRELLRASDPAWRAWVTPLTSMFLHAGLWHLGGNLLYLAVFGSRIEDLLGPVRFALFYLACGGAAAALHVASAPASWDAAVGASGAVSGVLGAYAVSYPTGRLRLLWPRVRVPAIAFLLLWIAIQITSGLGAVAAGGRSVAWWAHLGGFAAGAALGRPMWVRKPTRSRLRI